MRLCSLFRVPEVTNRGLHTGTLEELIKHGLHALRETLQQDKELTINNTSIGIIGPGGAHEENISAEGNFRILEGEIIQVYLDSMIPKDAPEGSAQAPPPAPADAPPAGTGDEDVQMGE